MTRRGLWLAALGLALITLAVAGAMVVQASAPLQEPPPNLGAEYIGSTRCRSCHNAEGSRLWNAWFDTLHAQTIRPAGADNLLGDFSAAEALTISWPDGETRPITAQDVTYVINGRYVQQYITVRPRDDGSNGYMVLPVQWNIPQQEDQVGTWTAIDAPDWAAPESDWRVTCAGCHTSGLTRERLEGGASFHFIGERRGRSPVEIGVGCESCHGPGGAHARSGGREPVVSAPDAQICGQCHSQGHDANGSAAFPLDYEPGLPLDESVFALIQDDTVWWPTGHTRVIANQYPEWLGSAHSGALSAVQGSDLADDSCLYCHSTGWDSTDPTPDETTTLATAAVGVTCTACHNPHASESAPRFFDLSETPLGHPAPLKGESLPPRQEEPAQVYPYLLQTDTYSLCVDCHSSTVPEAPEPEAEESEGRVTLLVGGALHYPVQEMFEGWPLVEGVDAMPSAHFAAADGPRCVTCHMVETAPLGQFGGVASHTMAPVMPGAAADIEPDSCTACHTEIVTRQDVQRLIDDTQAVFTSRLDRAHEVLANGEASERVQTALQLLAGDGSQGVHNFRYADALMDVIETELGISPAVAPEPSMNPYIGSAE